MKYFLIIAILTSVSAFGAKYVPNDGENTPGTFDRSVMKDRRMTTIEREEAAPATVNKTGVRGAGISTEDLNTSPNRAPTTDNEVIEGSALYKGDRALEDDETIEAQEAEPADDAVDYSTLPEGSEVKPLEPDYD